MPDARSGKRARAIERGGQLTTVAQVGNLRFRRLAVGWPQAMAAPADCQFAIRQTASLRCVIRRSVHRSNARTRSGNSPWTAIARVQIFAPGGTGICQRQFMVPMRDPRIVEASLEPRSRRREPAPTEFPGSWSRLTPAATVQGAKLQNSFRQTLYLSATVEKEASAKGEFRLASLMPGRNLVANETAACQLALNHASRNLVLHGSLPESDLVDRATITCQRVHETLPIKTRSPPESP